MLEACCRSNLLVQISKQTSTISSHRQLVTLTQQSKDPEHSDPTNIVTELPVCLYDGHIS